MLAKELGDDGGRGGIGGVFGLTEGAVPEDGLGGF